MTPDNIRLLILYGSQTGTAEDLADRIGLEASRRQMPSLVCQMDEYQHVQLIHENLVLFICSTTGQGEEPDNMKLFWKLLLRKNLPPSTFKHLSFGVIGLGDSSYAKFNFVAKKLHKRLIQLGGTAIANPALGDDQHDLGYDAAVDPWLCTFWESLCSLYPNSLSLSRIDGLLPAKYEVVTFEEEIASNVTHNKYDDDVIKSGRVLRIGRVLTNQRLTPDSHFQDVRIVKFKIDSSDENFYCPGDVAVLQPSNPEESVNEFLHLLNADPHQRYLVTSKSTSIRKLNIPSPVTLTYCAKHFWDIQSIPRRSFFELLQYFSQDEQEQEKLQEFTTPEGQDELYSYCNRPRRSILEVLQDFRYTTPHIPLEYLFQLIPPIRPRYFSIASSPSAHPNEIHLLVAVVKYKTKLHKPRLGLCSNWIASLQPTDAIKLAIRKGSFRLPPNTSSVVLIGPGTGVAPFRSLLHERAVKEIGNNMLFFGNRNKNADFFCADEWKELVKKGLLTLFTAFSRDQDHKIYVQHRITEEGKLVWKMLSENAACILIAGSAKDMPQDVKKALEEVAEKYGQLSNTQAKAYFVELERVQRLQFEVWA